MPGELNATTIGRPTRAKRRVVLFAENVPVAVRHESRGSEVVEVVVLATCGRFARHEPTSAPDLVLGPTPGARAGCAVVGEGPQQLVVRTAQRPGRAVAGRPAYRDALDDRDAFVVGG